MMQISRVKRPKAAARQVYNRLSRFYDFLAGTSEAPFMRLGLEMLGIQPGECVLEIGSGTGKALVELGRLAGEMGLVVGLDLSLGMLHVARNHLTKANLAGRAHLLNGDGAWLPLASGSFAAIFMSFTLELFDTPEIPLVLAECWRVLKPGGRLGVVAMHKPDRGSPLIRLYEWFHDRFPATIDCRPIHAETMLQAAGFSIEKRLSKSMWGLPILLLIARKTPFDKTSPG